MAGPEKRIISKLGPYFYKLAENSRDVFWIRSADYKTLRYVSPAYEEIWGDSCQELYKDPSRWVNSVTIEDRDKLRQQLMEWQAHNSPDNIHTANFRIRTQNAEIRWIRDIGFPIYEDGKCIGYAGVAQDITSEKEHLKRLEDVSYFFRFFADKVLSVFWIKDAECKRQLYVSPAFEEIWGHSCDSLYQTPSLWVDSVLQEDLSNLGPPPEKPSERRYRIRRSDGGIRWIKDNCFPIRAEGGKILGYAGTAEDITASVQREEELREAKELAEKANRAKSDFLAMMSHELRTPLNAILGMAQILDQSELNSTQQDQLEVITQSSNNLLSLLNDLLDFSKLEVGKLSFVDEPVNLLTVVNRVINNLKPSAEEKGVDLSFDIAEKVPQHIMGDANRLRQILANLITNAIKFTHDGHVKVSIDCLQTNDRKTTLHFAVEDTGVGIEASKLPLIFDRFQQVSSVYQSKHDGVGLGLAIVKELVERMGGTITVTSEIGVGSQFNCVVPFSMEGVPKPQAVEALRPVKACAAVPQPSNLRSAVVGATVAQNGCASNLSSERGIDFLKRSNDSVFNLNVLVVEDNLINQRISRALLEQVGCHVDIAETGKSAIDKMKNTYDIVFMDIGLPDMNGFEAVSYIRKHETQGKRVPIVALTAHVFAHDRKKCFDVGMDEVMSKPIMREDLIAVLKRWAA